MLHLESEIDEQSGQVVAGPEASQAWAPDLGKEWPRLTQFRGCSSVCKSSRSPSNLLPFFGWEGSPTEIDYKQKVTLILSSLVEDLVMLVM